MAYNYSNSGGIYGCGGYSNGGLANYGQSVSSSTIDYNSLGLNQYNSQPQYGQMPSYGQSLSGQLAQCQQNPLNLNDPQLVQQVEQIVQSLNECKRPMLRRQVVTIPANYPGRVANISRRLPTPPPDIIERITVIKPPRDVINLCIEKPCQPGPCFQQKEICGKPRKPLIQPRVISVPPRSNPCQPPPPPPPPQPVCVPPPQPVCVPPPQPVCVPPPQPVCIPPPQPVCVPPPQPVCIPPPQPVCTPPPPACYPQPQTLSAPIQYPNYPNNGLVNSSSGFAQCSGYPPMGGFAPSYGGC